MRGLGILIVTALVAPALTGTAASGITTDVRIDGGDVAYVCEDLTVPAGATAYDALEACAAKRNVTLTWTDYGGDCFLTAVNGKAGNAIDPSGLWLLGEDWHFRVDGVSQLTGFCGYGVQDGDAISADYELYAAYFVTVPTPGTAVWIAQHLA